MFFFNVLTSKQFLTFDLSFYKVELKALYWSLSKNKDKVTMCFFGECGTGKSTALSLLADIYRNNHKDECEGQKATFVSGKSIEAVTKKVSVVHLGNLTLIDTPGTNDADKTRGD